MSTTALTAAHDTTTFQSTLEEARRDPGYQAFLILRTGFTVAPLLFGADKFANLLVDWTQYLAPWIRDLVPMTAATTMHLVGAIEMVAGLVVAFRPRFGGYLVAAWLAGIILNLLTFPGFYDVALRDFGLLLGALALARLGTHFEEPTDARVGR